MVSFRDFLKSLSYFLLELNELLRSAEYIPSPLSFCVFNFPPTGKVFFISEDTAVQPTGTCLRAIQPPSLRRAVLPPGGVLEMSVVRDISREL